MDPCVVKELPDWRSLAGNLRTRRPRTIPARILTLTFPSLKANAYQVGTKHEGSRPPQTKNVQYLIRDVQNRLEASLFFDLHVEGEELPKRYGEAVPHRSPPQRGGG